VAAPQVFRIAAGDELLRAAQFADRGRGNMLDVAPAAVEHLDLARIDIEAQASIARFAEGLQKRQADVAHADNGHEGQIVLNPLQQFRKSPDIHLSDRSEESRQHNRLENGELKMEKAEGGRCRGGLSLNFVSTAPYEASAKRRSLFEGANCTAAVAAFFYLLATRDS
ncbi:MAG: hypothetical protein O7G83_17560, partial [Proteobacteria bacterium]|nr:hypothetical protein [Pseudomonadota bacterium]